MATMASACCRFLIFIGPSFTPLKVERELQRRFAPHLIDLHVADFFGMPQLIEHSQKRLAVTGGAGTSDRREVPNFHCFCRNHAVLRKRLREFAQDAQVAERFVKPRAVFPDLLLHLLKLFDLRPRGCPFGLQPRELPLLEQEGPGEQQPHRTRCGPDPRQLL